MAICCPKSIKACALRITRQNECDVALDPLTPNSRIQTAGFMELNLSPDVEAGEDITTKNACGDICIRDKDCDRLKGFEVELKLCGVPLTVIEMLTGATLLADGLGGFNGAVLRDAKSAACEDSKMLELWSKNADKGVCDVDGTPANLYIHWVLPRTINWEISGGLNFTNGPLEVTLTGYAENNPLWFPSFPDSSFPSYVPGGGDPTGYPTGAPGTLLPSGVQADPWTLADQAAIQAGGPLAWRCVGSLPGPIDDCGYAPYAMNIEDIAFDGLWYALDPDGDPATLAATGVWPDAIGAEDWIDWAGALGPPYENPSISTAFGQTAFNFTPSDVKSSVVGGTDIGLALTEPLDIAYVAASYDSLDSSSGGLGIIPASVLGSPTEFSGGIYATDDGVTSEGEVQLLDGTGTPIGTPSATPVGSYRISTGNDPFAPTEYFVKWNLVIIHYDGANSWVEIDGVNYPLNLTAGLTVDAIVAVVGSIAINMFAMIGYKQTGGGFTTAERSALLGWKNWNYPDEVV